MTNPLTNTDLEYHMMVDLETFAVDFNSCIVSGGIVIFSLNRGIYLEEIARISDVEEQTKRGAVIDPNTVFWWLKQPAEARLHLTQSPAMVTSLFLHQIGNLFKHCSAIWSKDSCFDIVILENMYNRFKHPIPWNYRQRRCARTLFSEWPEIPEVKSEVKHDPLSDAKAQAQTVLNIWEHKRRITRSGW